MKRLLVTLVVVLAAFLSSMSGANAAELTSASGTYPVSITGTSTADVFDFFGSTVKCTENSFSGSIAGKGSNLKLTPTFKNCKQAGTFPVTVDITCPLEITFSIPGPTFHICNLKFTVFESHAKHTENKPMCEVTVNGAGGVTASNNANGTITLTGNVSGLGATQVRNSIFCPAGTSTTSAAYTIQSGGIILTGKTGGVANSIHAK